MNQVIKVLFFYFIFGFCIVFLTEPCLGAAVSQDVDIHQKSENAMEEGRGKMKNVGPLLAAGAMKMGMVGMLAFKALALLVGKALMVAKLAFLLAAIIGLKKLFSTQKHVTYEVVTHPHHEPAHHASADSYSSGWGRMAQDMAYNAQKPQI